jgi:competence protein ComEC
VEGGVPLVARGALALIAGLLAGYGGGIALALGVALAALGAACSRRDMALAALAVLLAAGALVAVGDDARRSECGERLVRARSWSAELEAAAAPGAFVGATLTGGGCAVHASLSVVRGSAPAGARVRVSGEAVKSDRGTSIRHARVAREGGRSLLLSLRASAGARIDRIFGGDAPMVRALLIADTHALPSGLRDRYASAGIIHMLSISGLHVGIIAAAMELIFVAARLPRRAAYIATLLITAVYVAIIGAPAPALRAGVMLAVVTCSRLLQRPTSPWAALSLGALVPLVNPRNVLAIGWQLSVIGIAGLIASAALARRWIVPRWDGMRAHLATLVLASVVASVVSAPLVAWKFGRLSLIAPATNVVATPVVAALQPTIFLALLCAPVEPVARFLAGAAHPMIVMLDAVARTGASVPFGTLTVAPTLRGAVLAGLATTALVVACVSYFPGRALVASAAAFTAALWLPILPRGGGELELHVIDVGQGDAVALRTPHGRWILVDAGRAWRGGDAGRATVIPYLRRRGGELALLILSHPHSDHVGGVATVLRSLHPAAYWDGAFAGTSEPYRASLEAAREAHVHWERVHPGDTLRVDGVLLRVLAPDSTWMSTLEDPNEASVVVLAQYGTVRFLLMGDAERGEERWLLENERDLLEADILKVGHHGSRTSSGDEFLDAVRPELAVISVGAGNSYGHPSPEVVRALARHGAVVLRTDRVGSVVVRTDGRRTEVEEGEDRWELSSDSSRR